MNFLLRGCDKTGLFIIVAFRLVYRKFPWGHTSMSIIELKSLNIQNDENVSGKT
jgi:hypothetical protein